MLTFNTSELKDIGVALVAKQWSTRERAARLEQIALMLEFGIDVPGYAGATAVRARAQNLRQDVGRYDQIIARISAEFRGHDGEASRNPS